MAFQIIYVGGGSLLVDHLLNRGHQDITALDIFRFIALAQILHFLLLF